MKFLSDKVLIKNIESITYSKGILLPDEDKDENGYYKGEVILTGPGKYQNGVFVKIAVKVGDVVYYSWRQPYLYNEEQCYLTSEDRKSVV